MNPLGINLWNWRPGLDEGCIGLPTRAAKMGFTAVELPMTTTCVPQTLADEICSSGLKVSLCAALGPGRDLSSFDHEVRADTMKYLTDCLKIGQSLGATVLAGPLYAGSGKCHRLSTEEKKREWELAVTGLKILAKRAEDCGIELALEPLNRYRTSVVNTTAQGIVTHHIRCNKEIPRKRFVASGNSFHSKISRVVRNSSPVTIARGPI